MTKLILIIDDDNDLRASLKTGLEQGGFAVVQAESAGEASEILRRVAPDAIILDRMMSDGDGLSFLRGLRADGDATPVIVLTAMSGPGNAVDGLSGGADDYLAKPFQLRELVLRLERLVKDRAPAAPQTLPAGLARRGGEFFVRDVMLRLSELEKVGLSAMLSGAVVEMAPMRAKRLRGKLLANMPNADIINVRNKGYKLVISC